MSLLYEVCVPRLQSFREINLDLKQEVILYVAASDLREVIALRYLKAEVWGSRSQTLAWIRITWRACSVHIAGPISRASNSEGCGGA